MPTTSLALSWSLLAALGQAPPAPTPASPPPTSAADSRYEESIDVVAVTPLRGIGVPRDQVPANVQTASALDLDRTGALQLGDALARGFAGVTVAEAQGNPFQPDLQVRGFTLSPLLGLPQGVAAFQDGVRVNEPFGDTLHWDLLPENAIASVDLMPGSNPLFGRNALGGTIAIQTKTGFDAAGHAAGLHAGSFGRQWVELETGGHRTAAGWFTAARLLEEEGWRDHSPSRVRQVFGSFESRQEVGVVGGTVTGGSNRLIGNGALPLQLLEENREAVFTHPDETENEVAMLTVRGDRAIGRALTVEGSIFYRPVSIDTFNGDDTPYEECATPESAGLLCAEGEDVPIHDQNGDPIASDDDLDATNNTSSTRTDGWGLALQATSTRSLGGRDNQLIAGAGLDSARSRYQAATELAELTADRGTAGAGIFDADAAVRLDADIEHASLWLADFWSATSRITMMGAARWTASDVLLRDRLGVELDGDHRFTRVDPSAGVTWQAGRSVTAFASFGASSRAPAPSELSCADPDDPCRLPNAFVADPPLDQVVARTWEAGARGRAGSLVWSGGLFHTTNRDDIVFVSSGALTNGGHFENIDETLRRGLEATLGGAIASNVRWQAAYSNTTAEFGTPLTLSSPHHPDAVGGEIAVERGDSLPGVPRHQLNGQVAWTGARASALLLVVYASDRRLRGDEANLLDPIDGFSTVDAAGSYQLRRGLTLSARVSNLLDQEYETFGLLGDAEDVLGDDFDDPRFLTPGAPRAAWVGLQMSWR
jgi:outer membrane receptor protein involved in Fe transport